MVPSTGTFISMDSYAGNIYDPVSLHKYLYANSNPVMNSDPSGYMSMTEMAGSLDISAILTYSLATVFLHMMHVKVEEVPIIGDFYRLNRDLQDFIEVIKVEKEAHIVIEVFPKLVFIKELFEVIYKTEFDFRNIEIFPAIEKNTPLVLTINNGNVRKKGDKTPKGREYTDHGAERANERNFTDESVDNIIDNNYKHRKKEVDDITGQDTWRYQDKRGNTVITNEYGDKIVSVYSYPKSKNGGNFIPKGE